MEVVHPRCCGMDVPKAPVGACLLCSEAGNLPHQEVRTDGTMTADLLRLVDWLVAVGGTQVAMESTGGDWNPVDNLWEGTCAVRLVTARHLKHVPGRTTAVRDWAWRAERLRQGVLRPRFIPARPPRERRERRERRALTRQRTALVQERAAEITRLQQGRAAATLKLAAVVVET